MQNGSDNGFRRVLDARLVLSIVAAGIMSFSGVCVETAMNITFPELMTEFGIDTSTVQWMTTAYLLVLAAIVPTSSFLNRRFPTKRIFAIAMLFYIAGIVTGFSAISFPMLLLGRILEGIGTGIALPLMFNIITEQAPLDHMGVMMGIGTLVTAMAPAVGPSVGGWLAENFGWRAIFAALLPVLAAAFFLGIFSIRQSHEVVKEPFDVAGWIPLVISFGSLVFAIDGGGTKGWLAPQTLLLFVLFAVMLALFVHHEKACERPLIHLSVFSSKQFDLGVLSLICLQFCVLGLSFLLPNYAQLVMAAKQTEAGTTILLGCFVGACIAPFSGQLLDRLGARKPIVFGASSALISCVLFALLSDHMPTMEASIVYILYALGQSSMVGNTMTVSLKALPKETKADGNAVINTLQQLSGAVGTSVVTALVNAAQIGASDMALATMAGSRTAYALLACIMIVPLLSMIWVTGHQTEA